MSKCVYKYIVFVICDICMWSDCASWKGKFGQKKLKKFIW